MPDRPLSTALIGHTGYVGSTLARQAGFDALYRSTTIQDIRGREFRQVVCAGAPGQKWLANREPAQDRASIDLLMASLKTVRCEQFILISTVDVFSDPVGVDEQTAVDPAVLQPYGLHRRHLEEFVQTQFPRHLIVRLPGLVGPGLRKNVVFDLHHGNALQAVDSRAVFQFYPMVNLWADLGVAMEAGLSLVHLTAEPLSVGELALQGFGRPFGQQLPREPARYDLQTRHAALFGGTGRYQYRARESLQAVRAYAQSEPRQAPPGPTGAAAEGSGGAR